MLSRLFRKKPTNSAASSSRGSVEFVESYEIKADVDSKNIIDEKGHVEVVEILEDEPDPELKDIPYHVRRIVSLHDDPGLYTITFRYFILTFLFVCPGAFVSQMSSFRSTHAPYSIFFVQVACHYAGRGLANVLPAWTVGIPRTKYSFSLNPGPWSIKEHVLVTISASAGAHGSLGAMPLSISELYYGQRIQPIPALLFMTSIVWVGYSFAAFARPFLLYDPFYVWPGALMQTTLFETFRKNVETKSRHARKQKHVFFLALIGMTLWQFLPEYAWPMLGSMAFLCYVAPHNKVANFVSSGMGGMGFANLTLDWSNVTSEIMLHPWWTQCITFISFVFAAWILIPAAKYGKLGSYKFGLMSNRQFTADGKPYPTASLLTKTNELNETAYALHGPIYMGTQMRWNIFFDYATYTSGFVWVMLFGGKRIVGTAKKFWEMRKNKVQAATINHKYSDRLNILQRSYREVPAWWFLTLFVLQFFIMIILLAKGYFYIPVWAYFIALLSGAAVVIPMGWLYAISNFTVNIMAFNEMLYGYMINTGLKNHHPAGVLTYGAIAGDAWVTAHSMLQDMKVGHYMHVPPRTIFFAQVFGSLIGIPINYGVIRWIIADKGPYLLGKKKDPLNQWTGQRLSQANTMAVQYVLIGPKRLFALPMYHLLPLGFFVGMVAPLLLFFLHRRWPKVRFDLCNATIFFAGLSKFYGNISTGNVSKFIGGYIVMRYAYRRRFEMWKRYNYIMAAAFDAGFNFNMMIIFIAFSSIKVVQMPHWFGNNAQSVERCFALPQEGGHHGGGHHGGADGTFTQLSATNGTGIHSGVLGHGHHHHHNTTQFKFF